MHTTFHLIDQTEVALNSRGNVALVWLWEFRSSEFEGHLRQRDSSSLTQTDYGDIWLHAVKRKCSYNISQSRSNKRYLFFYFKVCTNTLWPRYSWRWILSTSAQTSSWSILSGYCEYLLIKITAILYAYAMDRLIWRFSVAIVWILKKGFSVWVQTILSISKTRISDIRNVIPTLGVHPHQYNCRLR